MKINLRSFTITLIPLLHFHITPDHASCNSRKSRPPIMIAWLYHDTPRYSLLWHVATNELQNGYEMATACWSWNIGLKKFVDHEGNIA